MPATGWERSTPSRRARLVAAVSQLRRSPVHMFCEEHGLSVRTPVTLRDAAVIREFAVLAADVVIVAAYGLMLPEEILEAPRLGCINIHASLLPRWRGAAPIQRAIMAGDRYSGISIMQMDAGLDTGPVLLQQAVEVYDTMTGGALHDALASTGARLIVAALAGLADGSLHATRQSGAGVSYAGKMQNDERRLDWSRPAYDLECLVRALAPAPAAWCRLGGARLKVLDARVLEIGQVHHAAGSVIDDDFTIACGEGALRLLRVQMAGGLAMESAAFLRGNPIVQGAILP